MFTLCINMLCQSQMLKYIDVINVRVYLYGDTWKLEVEDGLYGDKKHNSIPAENCVGRIMQEVQLSFQLMNIKSWGQDPEIYGDGCGWHLAKIRTWRQHNFPLHHELPFYGPYLYLWIFSMTKKTNTVFQTVFYATMINSLSISLYNWTYKLKHE